MADTVPDIVPDPTIAADADPRDPEAFDIPPDVPSLAIILEDEVDPRELKRSQLNWRIHPEHQRDYVEALILRHGWVDRVLQNRRTGNLINGHLRVDIAIDWNLPTVPRAVIDVGEDRERELLIALDHTTTLAGVDTLRLEALLNSVPRDDDVLNRMYGELQATLDDYAMPVVPDLPELPSGDDPDGTETDAATFQVAVGNRGMLPEAIAAVRELCARHPDWRARIAG